MSDIRSSVLRPFSGPARASSWYEIEQRYGKEFVVAWWPTKGTTEERLCWLDELMPGKYGVFSTVMSSYTFFVSEEDAVLFALTWCGG